MVLSRPELDEETRLNTEANKLHSLPIAQHERTAIEAYKANILLLQYLPRCLRLRRDRHLSPRRPAALPLLRAAGSPRDSHSNSRRRLSSNYHSIADHRHRRRGSHRRLQAIHIQDRDSLPPQLVPKSKP